MNFPENAYLASKLGDDDGLAVFLVPVGHVVNEVLWVGIVPVQGHVRDLHMDA